VTFATEFDWMNFYWNVTLPGPLGVTVADLFAIDKQQDRDVGNENDDYLALGSRVLLANQAREFQDSGRRFGVSTDTSVR
jgi:hypothetical protein